MEPSDGRWHVTWTWLGDMSGFHVFGQPLAHEVFLLVCLVLQLLSFAAAVLVLFDGRRRFRLLWSLACLVGFGKIIVNWSAAGWDIFPISADVPAVRIFRGVPALWGAAPTDWFVTLSVPVIAVIYLLMRLEPAASEADLPSKS